jgi:hypothetical protein
MVALIIQNIDAEISADGNACGRIEGRVPGRPVLVAALARSGQS